MDGGLLVQAGPRPVMRDRQYKKGGRRRASKGWPACLPNRPAQLCLTSFRNYSPSWKLDAARRDYGKAICTRGRRRRRRRPFIGPSKLWQESDCTASAPPKSPKVEGGRKTGEAFGIGQRWRGEGNGEAIFHKCGGGSFFIHAAGGRSGFRGRPRSSLVHPAITGVAAAEAADRHVAPPPAPAPARPPALTKLFPFISFWKNATTTTAASTPRPAEQL